MVSGEFAVIAALEDKRRLQVPAVAIYSSFSHDEIMRPSTSSEEARRICKSVNEHGGGIRMRTQTIECAGERCLAGPYESDVPSARPAFNLHVRSIGFCGYTFA